MKINIKACQLEITPAIAEYINEKVGSLEKFVKAFETKCEATVEVEISRATKHHRQGDVYYAEANLLLDGKMIRAEENDEDMRAAIDKVKDKLKLEVSQFKEKIITKRKAQEEE